MHLRHDRFNKRDQQRATCRCPQLQQVVAAADQVGHGADGGLVRVQTGFQSHQIQEMEFALLQFGAIAGGHQQFLTHQRLCRIAIVDTLQAHDEQRLARQLTTFPEMNLSGFIALAAAQPAAAGAGEAFREIAGGVDPQFPLQPLGAHYLADHQPVFALGHALRGGSTDNDARTDLARPMASAAAPILPGTTVTVQDVTSIYNGYTGFVQRISGDRAAVLFEGGNWDKLVTMRLRDLQPA